jgi:hypothetical protein
MRAMALPAPAPPGAADAAGAADEAAPRGAALLALLCQAAGVSAALAVAPPAPGSLQAALLPSLALLGDVCGALQGAGALARPAAHVAYFLLLALSGARGAAPGEAAHFSRRCKALALLGAAARVPALALALANAPAFAGAYAQAQLPGYVAEGAAALAREEAAGAGAGVGGSDAEELAALGPLCAGAAVGHALRLECGSILGCLLAPSPLPPAPSLLRISSGQRPRSPVFHAFWAALGPAGGSAGGGGAGSASSQASSAALLEPLARAMRARAASHTAEAVALIEALIHAPLPAPAAEAQAASAPQPQPQLLPAREAVLQWLQALLSANQARGRDSWEAREASSSGLMLNVAALLLRLCEPITLGAAPASYLRSGSGGGGGGSGAPDKTDRVAAISALFLCQEGIPAGLSVARGAEALVAAPAPASAPAAAPQCLP